MTIPRGFCWDDDAMITVGRQVRVGTRLNCPMCRIELEVLSLSSCEVGYPETEESGEERSERSKETRIELPPGAL